MTYAPETARPVASRRTVLRTAVHAAWVVPAVQIAAAAPAFATSSGLIMVDPAGTGATRDKQVLSVAVRLVGTVAQGSQVSLVFPAAYFRAPKGVPTEPRLAFSAPSWSITSGWTIAANGDRTTTVTATARTVGELLFVLTYDNNGNASGDTSGSIRVVTLVPGGQQNSFVISGAPR